MARRLLFSSAVPMIKNSRSTISLLFCIAFAAACSDDKEPANNAPDAGSIPDSGSNPDSGSTPDGGGEPPALTYCDGYQRGCERQIECGVVVYNHASSVADCLSQTACAQVATATLAAHGVELDAAKIADCKAKIDDLSCEELSRFRGGAPEGLESCAVFTRGTADEGEACSALGFEACKDGLSCDFGAGQCPGACTRIPVPCTQDGCEAGEYCSYLSGECVAQRGEGAICEPNAIGDLARRSCQTGLHCFAEIDQDPKCVARIPLGESCDVTIDVELCAEGSYCDPDSAKCVARNSENGSCNFVGMCREDLYCDFSSNLCRPQGRAGEACNDSAGSCALGLACDQVCKPAGEVKAPVDPVTIARSGEPCGVGIVCGLGLVCALDAENNAICAAAFAPGAACESAYDAFSCERGLCNFTTDTCPQVLNVGEACAPDGLYTGCPLALCINGKCASAAELSCEAIER